MIEEQNERASAVDARADATRQAAIDRAEESPSAHFGNGNGPMPKCFATGPDAVSVENEDADIVEEVSSDKRFGHDFAKRAFDIIVASATAVVFLPLIIGVAIKIRLTGSPVVFSHERIGKGRKPFSCYKFRSMVPDAETVLQEMLRSSPEILREWRESHKLKNDPRVTPFGKFLRESSLDELPQLWNVIKGDMSLVGPRPIVADEVERYGSKAQTYYSVKPGMTGLWQIMGRSGVTYSRRVSMDTLYVRKQGIALDIWILLRTAVVVLRRVGAH